MHDTHNTDTICIRDAVAADMDAARTIYNALVPTSTVAWTETEQTLEARAAWFADQQRRGDAVLVADDAGSVVGFCAYGPFRGAGKWTGYRCTVEHTIHVARSHWGTGVGRRLLLALMERAASDGNHVMVGAIDGANTESIRFHEKLGFHEVARMPEIGTKFGEWLDLVLMQRILTPGAPPPPSTLR